MMFVFIACILSVIFLLLSLIHLYWAFGGKWGLHAAIPTNENNEQAISPKFVACIIVAAIMIACALYMLIVVKIWVVALPNWVIKFGTYGIGFVFLLRAIGDFKYVGFFKKIRTTIFATYDTLYFSPLCLLMSILAFIVAVSTNII